jgi:mono/diheme cytochrome c family protein
MRRLLFVSAAAALAASFSVAALAQTATPGAAPARYGLGRAATPDEIRRLDIDVMPDGTGLPEGRGTVAEGAAIYAAKCASCHGKSGEGASFDRLVATDAGDNFAFGRDPRLARAIGNYWPYASTLFDYTARSMPFTAPGTLTANEVYGLVAYLLSLNQVVPDTAVMDKATLPKVAMPARDRFVKDNRTGGKVVK